MKRNIDSLRNWNTLIYYILLTKNTVNQTPGIKDINMKPKQKKKKKKKKKKKTEALAKRISQIH